MNPLNSIQSKSILFTIFLIGFTVSVELLLLEFINPALVIFLSGIIAIPIAIILFRFTVFKQINNFNKLLAEFEKNLEIGKRLEVIGENEFREIIIKINKILVGTEKVNNNLEIFKIAIENSNDQVVIADSEGVIQYVNKETEKLTGYTKEELIGKTPRVWGGQMKLEFYKNMWDTIKNQKKIFEAELTNKRKDGTLYPVKARIEPVLDRSGNVKNFIAVQRDISLDKKHNESLAGLEKANTFLEQSKMALANILDDTRELEEQLKQEKEGIEKKVAERTKQLEEERIKLSASISSLTVGFILTDKNNNILTINQSAKNLIFSSRNSTIAIEKFTLVHLEDELKGVIDLKGLINQSMEERKPVLVKEVKFNDKFLKIIISPITEMSDVLGCVVLIEDTTEVKILERSKDEFFSIASHELRTPLTAIRGNVSLIKQYYSDKITDSDLRSMIDDIGESSIRLIKIVNDFLNMSRLEMGKMQFDKKEINLVELVEGVIKEYETAGSIKEINLRFNPPKTQVSNVLGDMDKSREIVVNLIGNSLKYTEKGEVVVFIQENTEFVKVLVKDTGKGISLENQRLLFHKFQQAGSDLYTRDSSQSTGLGLYISKRMAEGMGGRIALENSVVGVGSTFSFSLPVISKTQSETVAGEPKA